MSDNTVPCERKLGLLNAFCSKVRELHFASRDLATLVLSNADAEDIECAQTRCQALRAESGGIKQWYDQHDLDCASCRQLALERTAKRLGATA